MKWLLARSEARCSTVVEEPLRLCRGSVPGPEICRHLPGVTRLKLGQIHAYCFFGVDKFRFFI